MNNIIVISGLKNSGKDTVADMLQYCLSVPEPFRKYWMYRHYRYAFNSTYEKVAFADSLKDTLSVLFGIPVEKFYERDFKEHFYIKGLEITDTPDNILDEDSFIKMLNKKDFSFLKTHFITIRQLLQCFGTEIVRGLFGNAFWAERAMKHNFDKMIITDLRFKVELEAVRKRNGLVLYIDNPNCTPEQHTSESEVLEMKDNHDFDFIIENNGTLEDLFNKIVKWMELQQC